MKRIAAIGAAVVVTGLLVATASAALRHYAGTVDQGGTITFAVAKHNGNKSVKHFHLVAPADCKGGRVNFDNAGAEPDPMPVTNGRFHGNVSLKPHGLIKVSGRLTHRGKKAFGKIAISGDITHQKNCSGHDTWNAARK